MLRLATVQMDFIPSAVAPGQNLWTPAEPLAWRRQAALQNYSLSRLAQEVPGFAPLRNQVQSRIVDLQNRRLEQILSFLEHSSIDLCVFPEYAFIVDETTLRIFAGFSPKVTIVAGMGVLRGQDLATLGRYTKDDLVSGTNVAVVFDGTGSCQIITKKHAADDEHLTPGSGARLLTVRCKDEDLRLGVAICKDYVVGGHNMVELEELPDVLAVPAYTSNLDEFQPTVARDFPRIFANHADFGGSTIFASSLEDRFVHERSAQPIPPAAEGIMAIEWNGAQERPKRIRKKPNRVILRSAMVSSSDGQAISNIVRDFQNISGNNALAPDNGFDEVPRWLDYIKTKPRLALIADSLQLYRNAVNDGLLTPDLGDLVSRHLVARETLSVADFRVEALDSVTTHCQKLLRFHDSDLDKFKLLLGAAEKYAEARGPRTTGGDDRDRSYTEPVKLRLHFSIGLGRFDAAEAAATLSEQQDMLLMFARSSPMNSRICYRLETDEDPASGNVYGRFTIEVHGPDDEESREYYTSAQRIMRSVFLRGWETYTARENTVIGHTVFLIPRNEAIPRIRDDYGFLVDVLRATGGGCVLTIVGARLEDGENALPDSGSSVTESTREINGDDTASWFRGQPPGRTGIGVRVSLTTPNPNPALANLVGAALFSAGDFTVAEPVADDEPVTVYPVEIAHRILHPPHGRIEGRGLGGRRPLFVPINEVVVFREGAALGTASAARPFVDKEIPFRLPEDSRLLHTYVIGRTGVGKTNTLKNLTRHDLEGEKAVIVIDPHGDLYDYAIRHAAHRSPLVALDFSHESPPSLNPIYLDARNEADVLDNIESLIEVFLGGTFHEWAGPRFTDLLRLCLHTLVATANEPEGHWAHLGDVLNLIEDKVYRSQVISTLTAISRTDLVRQWHLHQKMQQTEQAEVEQWFISKFGDFRRPGALTKSMSGKPSVNLNETLSRQAAVLVKIPAALMGNGPSKLLGALIVDRILRFTMRGGFVTNKHPALLIVDEFQNFFGTSFSTLIPEARKFNLGITLANQTISQLSGFSAREGNRNDDLTQVILGNVGNLLIQGVSRTDAEVLSREVGLTAEQLTRIGKHTALAMVTVNGERLNPFTVNLSDSAERPGTVAESVAADYAKSALAKLSEDVIDPKISRERTESQSTSPDSQNDLDFVDRWIIKNRHKRYDTEGNG